MKQALDKKCKNLTILFIEDYIPLQKKIASVLSDYFENVEIASDGKEGIEKYKKIYEKNGKFYDIVITDYEMPKINGIELIKTVKKLNDKQIFIVISAYQNSEYLIEYINLGIEYFIPKPIGPDNLLNVLDKVSDKFIFKNNELFYLNDSLIWDKKNKLLFCNNESLKLSKYDLLLFEILVDSYGSLCNIDRILSHFYINNEDIQQENIRNMVVRLRKKIPKVTIESIYAMGYKLVSSI